MITRSQALTPGGVRQKAGCFQLPCRPGGVSGWRGRVSGWSSAGWGLRGQSEASVLPSWPSGHIMSPVPHGWASSPLLCHFWWKLFILSPWGRRLVWENERKEEKKNTQVLVFFFFSLEWNITHRSCKRNWLLVRGYGFTSQPLPFGFQSGAIWRRKHQQEPVIGPQEIHSGVFVLLNEQHCCL